ncbi:hypothetical protein [Lactobacillus helveticus]|uniref:hypothetical protein n=1 Tax=Lactobacillus helveticus TaxID=1587 RepID=UPI001C6459C1|nr:hypothetical protein [Lactobacillus helveticus]MBW8009113.1 hypothetical protein [Lactobacillus helveticus]MBW8019154.1 hypothetical protein [Lactobacillus helveticus]MBW8043801.1 hypothetical protein [Lactobacillus helveticus]MBW8052414.1 hypothetical protein [Lactobacillus helveticus]
MIQQNIKVTMKKGTQLAGVKFTNNDAKTVFIAMTGVGGNIRSNHFYTNIGNLLSKNNIDFIVLMDLMPLIVLKRLTKLQNKLNIMEQNMKISRIAMMKFKLTLIM